MDIAERTAIESNCVKYKVGAVIVKDNRIILQGYNGNVQVKYVDEYGRITTRGFKMP